MCRVNDAKRAACDREISALKNEQSIEYSKLKDIGNAKAEVEQLINKAQCAIDNLADCNFGTREIDHAVETSKEGYLLKKDYYEEYALKCQQAINTIETEINNKVAERNAIPQNCGSCKECCPPEPVYYGGSGGSSSGGAAPTYKGSGCFLKGTKIATNEGYKDIDTLEVGDIVLSYNEQLDKNEYKKVARLFLHENENDILYSFTINNKLIEASSAHKFYIKNNDEFDWIAAADLKINNIVVDSDGNYYPITNIESKPIQENLYNFEVEDNHNYYVTESEILVHNRK